MFTIDTFNLGSPSGEKSGLVALSAQDASAVTAAKQPVAPGEATDEMREADGAVGELTDDTVITAKVKAALLQDPGTAALAIGVETFIGEVRLSGSVKLPRKSRHLDLTTEEVSDAESRAEEN